MRTHLATLALVLVTSLAAAPLFGGDTPLQSAILDANLRTAKEKNKKQSGEKKNKCTVTLEANDADGIAKWCDVAKTQSKKLGEQSFSHKGGKAAGKRTVTQTMLEYESPNQKQGSKDSSAEKWPSPKLKAFDRTSSTRTPITTACR
jgi:hypothetical protein